MKFGNDISHRIERWLLLMFGVIFIFVLIYSGNRGDWFELAVAIVMLYVLFYGKYEAAIGELTEEGVYVRHFLVRRFYRWEDIRQAGVFLRQGRNSYYEIILVKPHGFVYKQGKTGFLFRNQFRLVHIPYDPVILHYIILCYGKLDFDQQRI